MPARRGPCARRETVCMRRRTSPGLAYWVIFTTCSMRAESLPTSTRRRCLCSPLRWNWRSAARDQLRVALRRRGTEYVVVAQRLETSGRDDVLAGRLPMTGELLTFRLRDLESFAVLP